MANLISWVHVADCKLFVKSPQQVIDQLVDFDFELS